MAILTGPGGITGNTATSYTGCYTDFIVGALLTDPTYGTAVIEHDPSGRNPDHRYPVMWLPGDTGRTSGSEVEILDRTGSVIARTGQVLEDRGRWLGWLGQHPARLGGLRLRPARFGGPVAQRVCSTAGRRTEFCRPLRGSEEPFHPVGT